MEQETSKLDSFTSAKVVIDTLSLTPIEDEAIIQVEDSGFRVSVFEAKNEFTIFHTGPLQEDFSSSPMFKQPVKVAGMGPNNNEAPRGSLACDVWQKDHDHDEVQGDKGDEQPSSVRSILNANSNSTCHGQPRGSPNDPDNSLADVEKNQELSFDRLDGGRSEGVVGGSTLIVDVAEGINGKAAGRRVSNGTISDSSCSKTKEAQLSGIGYSEEMKKIFKQGICPQAGFNHLDVIGNGKGSGDSSPSQHGSGFSAPPGFDIEVTSAPPGFEGVENVGASKLVKKNPRRKQLCTEKRVTRSQRKLGKCNSQITTESMRKLVEESLEIGKMLGVKIIANEENAKRNLIDSLKEEKRRKNQPKRGVQRG